MEQFIVSARKYRPTTFKDVVGQQAITNTLENAISNNQLAQALLFTGPRGVGKTTCARILAKRINQDAASKGDEDFAFNIFELDAASNNSVDDIRNLIDQVRIPPQVGKYKVYIIDEVHMLSAQAFNAFLKTLEEPPKHAIFILATTEKHKIIPTILSRCQIFDFKRIGVQDIKSHLAEVAKAEGIEADDDALHIIAQKADGALRDSLSIFDRVVSFSGKKLTREAVTENLNVLDYTWYFKITDFLLQNDIPQVLMCYNQILSKGFDGHHFIMGLASHFRDLLVCQNTQTIELLEVGEQVKALYFDQAKKTSQQFLIEAINLANDCDLKYKSSQNQRLLVELCLMKLASLTFKDEKKKSTDGLNNKIIPPSYFSQKASAKTKTENADSVAEPEHVNREKETANKEEKAVEIKPAETKPTNNVSDLNLKISSLENRKKRTSALSLRNARKRNEVGLIEEEDKDTKNLPASAFTQEQLVKYWNKFAAMMEKKGRFNLWSHLTMQEPKAEGALIHLEFPNNTIKTELEQEKHELLHFLREKLNNYTVDLSITVNEEMKQTVPYSEKDKYEYLKEKNPAIEKLRKALDLDF